ncbi:hypothetical protein MPSEU_000644100 [Mayamaea pseudoterrestris]|nr:hypothetical protein MPSEU_000644100 [Mayamaea pseudoterrestris]
MASLFRASNELELQAESGLTEVSFNVSIVELLVQGWTWMDLHHFGAHRILCCHDGAVLLHSDHMNEILQASIQLRALFCFSWTPIGTEFSRKILLCIEPSGTDLTTGNMEIAESFTGLISMFSSSSAQINLTVQCLINDPSSAHLPLLALNPTFRHDQIEDAPLESNLRQISFHSINFAGRTYHHLTSFLQGIDQLDLDSVYFENDDWVDFIRRLQQVDSLRVLKLLHSHRPSRRQSKEIVCIRSEALLELVTGSRMELLHLCRQHRDKKLHPQILKQLKMNIIRKWKLRSMSLENAYQVDGYTPLLPAALAQVSHDVDLTLLMLTANARALCHCVLPSLAEEQATLEADREELESILAKTFCRDNQGDVDNGICGEIATERAEDNRSRVDPLPGLDSSDLFYSIARDILSDD